MGTISLLATTLLMAAGFTVAPTADTCVDRAHGVYVAEGRAEEQSPGVWAVQVAATVKGEPIETIQVTKAAAETLFSDREQLIVFLDDSGSMLCPVWTDTTFDAGSSAVRRRVPAQTRVPVQQHVDYLRAYFSLREDSSAENINRVLRKDSMGARQAALTILMVCEGLGPAWDGLGGDLVAAFSAEKEPVDDRWYMRRMVVIARALTSSVRWRKAEGMSTAAWWADAELMLARYAVLQEGELHLMIYDGLEATGNELSRVNTIGDGVTLSAPSVERLRRKFKLTGSIERAWIEVPRVGRD